MFPVLKAHLSWGKEISWLYVRAFYIISQRREGRKNKPKDLRNKVYGLILVKKYS